MKNQYELKTIKNMCSEAERSNIYSSIDEIKEDNREWDKVDILIENNAYMDFLHKVTGASKQDIQKILLEYKDDKEFRQYFAPSLKELESMDNAGDLRFHAITLFVFIRSLKPETVVETGVAQGKSSAMLLLGLHKNQKGALSSIDLPNRSGELLADGAFTTTGNREVGWIVPDYLRDRWNLILGDAKTELPLLVKSSNNVDVFFHDSLHTYEHVTFEIETVIDKLGRGLIIVDNLETEAGKAFEGIVKKYNFSGYAFGNLGVIKVPH